MDIRFPGIVRACLVVASLAGGGAGTLADERHDVALLAELARSRSSLLHEAYRDGNWDIYLRGADGSRPVNLTRTRDVHELYPKASPDGKLIVFVADETLEGKRVRSVYLSNRDGSDRTLVARNARQPCWSPDSRTVAFLPGEFDKYTVTDFASKGLSFHDVATRKATRHANEKIHHLYNICYSGDGKWIIATVHGGMGFGHAILAVQVGGNRVHDLKIGGCRPDISPDGRRIAWGLDDHTIAVGDIRLDREKPEITGIRHVVKSKQHVYHADWSPDGKYISFSHGPGGRVKEDGPGTSRGLAEFVGVRAKWDLYAVRVEGGKWARLTDDGLANKESDWLPPVRKLPAEQPR